MLQAGPPVNGSLICGRIRHFSCSVLNVDWSRVNSFFCPVGATEFSPGHKADHTLLVTILGNFGGRPNKELVADVNTVVWCWHFINVDCIYQSLKPFLWPHPGELDTVSSCKPVERMQTGHCIEFLGSRK
jgi:hypothetical protein